MTVQIESLFTAALGLQAPRAVESVDLDNARHRIDFLVGCTAQRLACPSLSGILCARHSMTTRSMNATQDKHRYGGQGGAAANSG